jgi:NAD(P)-dependent dehydrogenase (short-subunit alcohol dehydrogenase family)
VHATYRSHPPPVIPSASRRARFTWHFLDVRNATCIGALRAALTDHHLSVIIYAAGINVGSPAEQTLVNARAPFAVLDALMGALPPRRRDEGSHVVVARLCLITSDLGTPRGVAKRFRTQPHLREYARSKLAANTRFRELEPSWRARGLTAVAMHPGFVATDMNHGTGQLTPAESATGILRVVASLNATHHGWFVNYRGQRLQWSTGQPSRVARPEAIGAVSSPVPASAPAPHGKPAPLLPLPAEPQPTAWKPLQPTAWKPLQPTAWKPLTSTSAAGLRAAHPDPLEALSTGSVPAVILRGVLSPGEAQALSDKLLAPSVRPLWTRQLGRFASLGAALSGHLGKGRRPKALADDAARHASIFAAHGLTRPIEALHDALRQLGNGRAVGVGVDLASNRSFPGGIYRMNFNNNSFPLHLDSLRSHEFAESSARQACDHRRYTPRAQAVAPQAAEGGAQSSPPSSPPSSPRTSLRWFRRGRGQAQWFADLYRFETQFSALLLLQRSDVQGAELSAYRYDRASLLANCDVAVQPTAHNVHVLEPAAALAAHDWPESELDVRAGDVYVFNANHLHVVHPIGGRRVRLSLGTFVGYSKGELRIWS